MVGISKWEEMLVALVGFSFNSVRSAQLYRQKKQTIRKFHFILFIFGVRYIRI